MNREVGWVITADGAEIAGEPGRTGWGQLRVHAAETESSFERIVGRTIFMDTSLTEHMIPEEARVRWRSFSDEGDPSYMGFVNVTWLFDNTPAWNDLAYNIDRFCMEDVGATRVLYSADDIIRCAKALGRPTWERFATEHPASATDDDERWLMIYG
jgi:hypothetical protein